MRLWAYLDTQGPDQPVLPIRLIMVFTCHLQNQRMLQNATMTIKALMRLQSSRSCPFFKQKSVDIFSNFSTNTYCIQPNFHTVCLGFSKILGKLVVKYVPTYTKGTLKKKMLKTHQIMLMRCLLVFLFFFSDFLYKSTRCGYHLNCMDLSMQFKWVPTIYAFIRK